jgi:peptidoglycan/LPS O-acetylase OafA/YrhL
MKAQEPQLSHPKYRPDIDGLRAVAVLAVVLFHAFPDFLKGGFIGVDVFFVISGYLISTIIFENLDRGSFSFSEFYARRVKRIFPALILVLIACFIFGWFVLLDDELKQLGRHIAAGSSFVSNFVLWYEAGYFDKSVETKPLLHLWSLGIEEQFYIVWPLLLYFSWKRKFNFLTIIILVAGVSFFLNINGVKEDPVATFYSPQTRFWELLCGSLLAWFTLYKKSAIIDKTIANFTSLIGAMLLVCGFLLINKELNFPGMLALIPVLGAVLIIFSGPKSWINHKILSNKIAVWFGLISFPIYLWHWPLLSFATISNGKTPDDKIRIAAVFLSIVLAWLTVKFIEKPFRYGNRKHLLKIAVLCGLIFVIGVSGLVINKVDLSKFKEHKIFGVKRKDLGHAIGDSLMWYKGKEDWLFLGNSYDDTVAKLKLAIVPSEADVEVVKENFSNLTKVAVKSNTKVVLFIGPNKSTIYPEYLPDELVPSKKRYVSFFLDDLKTIPNLTVYDPANYLINSKKSEGILYWMTNTHWNDKGAFLSYLGFAKLFNFPVPNVEFKHGSTHSGDLIEISKLKNFPLHAEDNWDVVWKNKPIWTENKIPNEQKTTFGFAKIVINKNPLLDKYIWIVGDSFAGSLEQYFNATFKEVRYIGHWADKLEDLPNYLEKVDRKPDMIIVVRVERSF